MKEKTLECVICPIKCMIKIFLEDEDIVKIKGYSCEKGLIYSKEQLENSYRFVTGTVKVLYGHAKLVDVRTKYRISKSKIFEVMKEISKLVIEAPVNIGDIVIENVSGTDVDVIAIKSVNKLV